ncbi:uncharacterized protein EV422DRAFT_563443 [Fimicolochytrium jonesii]|uniref:uncharacterized protein n=1 Tax=Fimicolochytrium jonesii TaxID=1396493 RepID=UPI0022FE1E17|nr:uncharacterized protein EV422DRAFT_563443 [Fimicolochytrium jonesii]KAI8825612.1 hypothetical protein EV422DRAFT_563443 [Fimicolochytrium jonesii]
MAAQPTYEDLFGGSDSELDDIAFSGDERAPPPAGPDDEDDDDYEPVQLPSFKKLKPSEDVEIPEELKRRPKKKAKAVRARRRSDAGDERGRSRGDGEEDSAPPERELSPESKIRQQVEEDFERMSKKNKKKKVVQDEADTDEILSRLLEEMKAAAMEDKEANRRRQPALAKLGKLPGALMYLQRDQLQDQILDNHLLEGVRLWLEPLPDASLPALDIQRAMFDVLRNMDIATIHLRESHVGRIVNFYSKCGKATPDIQKIASQLIDKWMRPILGRSASYRDHKVVSDPTSGPRIKRVSRSELEVPVESEKTAFKRTRIPQKVSTAFTVIPKSDVQMTGDARVKSEKYKRLESKMKLMKTGGRGR